MCCAGGDGDDDCVCVYVWVYGEWTVGGEYGAGGGYAGRFVYLVFRFNVELDLFAR